MNNGQIAAWDLFTGQPLRVRWQDGHESVYFPGPDARVVSAG